MSNTPIPYPAYLGQLELFHERLQLFVKNSQLEYSILCPKITELQNLRTNAIREPISHPRQKNSLFNHLKKAVVAYDNAVEDVHHYMKAFNTLIDESKKHNQALVDEIQQELKEKEEAATAKAIYIQQVNDAAKSNVPSPTDVCPEADENALPPLAVHSSTDTEPVSPLPVDPDLVYETPPKKRGRKLTFSSVDS